MGNFVICHNLTRYLCTWGPADGESSRDYFFSLRVSSYDCRAAGDSAVFSICPRSIQMIRVKWSRSGLLVWAQYDGLPASIFSHTIKWPNKNFCWDWSQAYLWACSLSVLSHTVIWDTSRALPLSCAVLFLALVLPICLVKTWNCCIPDTKCLKAHSQCHEREKNNLRISVPVCWLSLVLSCSSRQRNWSCSSPK